MWLRKPIFPIRRLRRGRVEARRAPLDPSISRVGLLLASLASVPACELAPWQESEPRAAARIPLVRAVSAGASASGQQEPEPKAPAVPAATVNPRVNALRGCPPEMVRVEESCIDRYEAHLATSGRDGGFSRHPAHLRPTASERYFARSEAGVRPQAYMSRVEAAAACENSDKRLCSAKEWFRACRGSERTPYPYGRRFERGRCNVGKAHLLSLFFGSNPLAWKYEEHFNNPKMSLEPGFLANTGEYSGCVSDLGVYDMVGNLQEWIADRSDRSLAAKVPLMPGILRSLGSRPGKGVFMGGFYSTTSEHGKGCAFLTAAHEVKYHDYSTGFRCCRDPIAR